MEREVRYCTASDGVRLAYSVEGRGPALLWSPLIFESLTKEAMTPVIAQFLGRLRERFQVVRFDTRGTGLSQREVSDYDPAATGIDIEAVL